MPTYEYRCSAGHEFEQFQRMSEEPLRVCPQCGAPAERLLSSGAGLVFKGSGFYITDYRSDAYRKAAAADTGKAGDAGSSGAAPSKSSSEAETSPARPASGKGGSTAGGTGSTGGTAGGSGSGGGSKSGSKGE